MSFNTSLRRLARIVTTSAPEPGFMGPGHTAVVVVNPAEFASQDPFILLADDRIDMPDSASAGGAHPHAGFETVTFLVDGYLEDLVEGSLSAGDVQWMTAGSGVIHNEDVTPKGPTRILQLWLTLPHEQRWSAPRFETITKEQAPVRREAGVELRVYSGSSGNVRAHTHNYVPVTMVDITLSPQASVDQDLPGSYNGFVYVLEGSVRVGANNDHLVQGQVGWLDRADELPDTQLRLTAEERPTRVLLYAGQPTNVPIVTHGPFVGETRADLVRVSSDYIAGRFPRMSDLAKR